MRYNIIGKNIDVWDKTKEMVEKKMDRIAKLFLRTQRQPSH